MSALLKADPQVWVLMRAVVEIKRRGEDEVLADIAEFVDRDMWIDARFWAEAIDAARGLRLAGNPSRTVPPLDLVLEHMAGALTAYRAVAKEQA